MTIRNFSLALLTATLLLPSYVSAQSSRKVKAKFTWEIANTENTQSLSLRIMVPTTIEGRQQVNSVWLSVKPDREVTEKCGSRYVVFNFESEIPREIVMEADITLFKSGLNSRKKSKDPAPDAIYLGDDKFTQTSNPQIKSLAAKLKGSDETETVRNIMSYIATTLTYYKGPQYARQGNIATLNKKTGVCGDYADLMIALCRANGIPARLSGGYLFERDFLPGWDGDAWHVWADVYLKDYGWVPFEPTRDAIQGWQSLGPQYIYIAQDLLSSELKTIFHYNYRGWRPRVDSFMNIR